MRIVLWILQSLLALQFAFHGWILLVPPAELVEAMNALMAPGFRLFLGVAELLAAIGIILPAATRILPWLTSLAALGMMIVVASATVLHLMRGETTSAIITAVLLVMATVVAYMRWKITPIAARSLAAAPR